MKMASAKAKGRHAENRWVEYLRAVGWPYAERRRLNGINDLGDITGTIGITWEVKNQKQYSFPEWMRELAAEQANTGDPVGVLVVKPRGVTDPAEYWCVLTGKQLTDLLRQAGWGSLE
mgnify:CR=1 FL=1|jgi:hypothetical protein